jgi:hypothetical protein
LVFSSSFFQSIVNEVAKAVVANYNASELITRRAGVAREIEEELVSEITWFLKKIQFNS